MIVIKAHAKYSFSDPAAEWPVFEAKFLMNLADEMKYSQSGGEPLFTCSQCGAVSTAGNPEGVGAA